MPSSSPHTPDLPYRDQYTLELRQTSGHYVVQAILSPTSELTPNSRSPNDFQFNLSTIIGCKDNALVWGGGGFEKNGEDFTLKQNSRKRVSLLTGKILDLYGAWHDVELDLDERLQIVEYVDPSTRETYHKLAERHPTPPGRTLVLCFDGTSNHFSRKNTNVVKLVELLKKDDPSMQMVYYQTGVGTYSPPGLTTSAGLKVASTLDEGIAWYFYQHVIDGYKYLMQTYRAGDKIAIFGFSRGAFTARALAGMLHCVGLLPRHNPEHIPFAYEVYKNAKEEDDVIDVDAPEYVPAPSNTEGLNPKDVNPKEFKRAFCVPVLIDFVGVWDTVASIGAFLPMKLPYIEYNPSIMIFRQALALDERRGSFIPSVWNHAKTISGVQDAREVWFRGEHSDIGGGSAGPGDSKKHPYSMLSNITLRWMIRQIVTCETGILFNRRMVNLYRQRNILETPPNAVPLPNTDYWAQRLEASIKLDKMDVQNEIYDSIGWDPLWNGLEYLGFTAKLTKNENFESTYSYWPNGATGRSIYRISEDDPIYIHGSAVDYMMVARELAPELKKADAKRKEEDYKPRAKWHGYKEEDWPCVEDMSSTVAVASEAAKSNAGFPESAQIRLDMVRPAPVKSWWKFR